VQHCLFRQTQGTGGLLFWGGGHVTVYACLMDTNERYPRVREASVAQVVGNVFFDWGAHASRVSDGGGGDWIANVWVPTSRSDRGDAVVVDATAGAVYIADNLGAGRSGADRSTVDAPVTDARVPTLAAREAYGLVVRYAGAPLDARTRTGRDARDSAVVRRLLHRSEELGLGD